MNKYKRVKVQLLNKGSEMNKLNKSENLSFTASEELKTRLKRFSNENEISQSGAIRMILNQNLPEADA